MGVSHRRRGDGRRFRNTTMTWKHLRLPLLIVLSWGSLLFVSALAVGKTSGIQAPTRKSAPARSVPEGPAAVPFHAGEGLAFRVIWSKFSVNAGNLELSVLERRDFFGRLAWHFQATAHSMDTMRILYALDDQFDSYADAGALTSLQYEMYLHEQGKQQNNSWRMSTANSPSMPTNVTIAQVLPGTRDPVGLIYALRAADWTRQAEFRAPVFDGHNLYEVIARPEQSPAEVTVPAGQFSATCINVRVFQHGQELSDTHFAVWLAQNATHTPVLIEAAIPLGTARVELAKL